MSERRNVQIDDRTLRVSNLDKVMYPATGFTKGQVIDYYARIAPVMLPHLRGRPLTLQRYPDGVEGDFFFEKTCPAHRPDWLHTAEVDHGGKRGVVRHCLLDDRPSLAWAANLASLEMHVSLAQAERIERPTAIVFDLDPGAPANLRDCIVVALELHGVLDELGLRSLVKSSGGKGLHLYIPLNTPTDYEHIKPFAKALASLLAKRSPRTITANIRKDLRRGKVLIDWSQNSTHKTTVCAYSLRARGRPTVSAPLSWSEVDAAHKKNDPDRLLIEADAMLKRVEKEGDLFETILSTKQRLPDL